ncbi:MAG TPA: hypothetical protein VKF36_21810 [Syntrophorhabdales bacterium]|nr:hypothetical protein [Syntrophorhabdales bacterium]
MAFAVIAGLFSISVPESMGQVSDRQKTRPEQITEEQQAAAPEKPAQEAGALPWRGPLFTLMAKMTENAKDTGSDTPANLARFEINDYYQKKAQSTNPGGQTEQNQQIVRMDFPISSNFTFRTDIPYVEKNGDVNGLGDVFSRLNYRIVDKPGFDFFALCDFYFPTGAQTITQGKFQAGPGFQVDTPIMPLRSVVKFRIQEFVSYAGNSSYKSINYTQAQARLYTGWSQNWWTELRLYLIVNWEATDTTQRGNTASKVELELGRKLGEHLRFYVRPGAGLWGIGQPNVYDWAVRTGIYYLF